MKKILLTLLLLVTVATTAFIVNSAVIMDAAYNNGYNAIGDIADLVTQIKTPAPIEQ